MLWWQWVLIIIGATAAILIIIRIIGGEGVILGILECVAEILGSLVDDD